MLLTLCEASRQFTFWGHHHTPQSLPAVNCRSTSFTKLVSKLRLWLHFGKGECGPHSVTGVSNWEEDGLDGLGLSAIVRLCLIEPPTIDTSRLLACCLSLSHASSFRLSRFHLSSALTVLVTNICWSIPLGRWIVSANCRYHSLDLLKKLSRMFYHTDQECHGFTEQSIAILPVMLAKNLLTTMVILQGFVDVEQRIIICF